MSSSRDWPKTEIRLQSLRFTRTDPACRPRDTRQRRACPECVSLVEPDVSTCDWCGFSGSRREWRRLPEVDDPWLGRLVAGRWEVLQPIASGTTGRVYRARDQQRHARRALKIVDLERFHYADDTTTIRRRARREAEVLGRVRSPHVVDFHELLELDDARLAMVMEFVTGPTLTRLVQQNGALPPSRALKLGASLAFAIAEVHGARAIHCDIKPNNVIVSRAGDGGDLLKLVDFGLAEKLHTPDLQDGRPIDAVGTPLFASPEQLRTEPVSRASDVYSVGATLFFALAGRPPFAAPTLPDLHAAHRYRSTPRLSKVTPSHVPPALDNLLADMMAQDPGDRPRDVHGIGRRLQQLAELMAARERSTPPLSEERPSGVGLQASSSLLSTPHTEPDIDDIMLGADEDSEPIPDVEEPVDGADGLGETSSHGSSFDISEDGDRTLAVIREESGLVRFTWQDPFGDEWTELNYEGTACAVAGCALSATIAVARTDGTISIHPVGDDTPDPAVLLDTDVRARKLRHAPDGYLLVVETCEECLVYCTASGELVHQVPREQASKLGF